jgi:hypothetical protein
MISAPIILVDHNLEGSSVGHYMETDRGNSYIYVSEAMFSLYRDDSTKCSFIDSLKIRMPDGSTIPMMELQRREL